MCNHSRATCGVGLGVVTQLASLVGCLVGVLSFPIALLPCMLSLAWYACALRDS
jgi:hypothetical protein